MGLFSGEARADEVFPYPEGELMADCLNYLDYQRPLAIRSLLVDPYLRDF
jgi:hypothetical protein